MNLFTDTTQPCPECDALDDADCPCRDCTKCHKHEDNCECGVE